MGGNQFTRVIQRLRRAVAGPSEGPGDPELLRRYASGREEQAFTALVERHGPMVRGVCRRVLGQDADADDAFQATFLVLARKADSAFWQESIAGWLYQTAYRTAQKARATAARRQRHEQEAGRRPKSRSPEPDELRQVLDEELNRLPEKFRLPVLLCCLQDQTTDEAARQLGWSFSTVKGRLQRGREMLRQRLQKRGIALSAGVLGTLLAEGSAGAVPTTLVTSTVQTAIGGSTAPAVAALAKGVCQIMFWDKMKVAAAVLMVTAILGIGGGIGVSRMGTEGRALAVPVPDDPATKTKAPEGPVASKPVIKDGLEVVVRPKQAVIAAGEKAIPMEITYTNRGGKAFRLDGPNQNLPIKDWTCTDVKTGIVWCGGMPPYVKRVSSVVELAPDKSVTMGATIMGFVQRKGPGNPDRQRDMLPPGRYRVTAILGFGAAQAGKVPGPAFWTGEITTNPVEVVIAK